MHMALHKFGERVEDLHPLFETLCDGSPFSSGGPAKLPKEPGVYLFSGNSTYFYVGRTRNIRRRYAHHRNAGSPPNQAALAVLLACEEIKAPRPAYRRDSSRTKLYSTPRFKKAFRLAKERVRNMDFRFVEIADDVNQALFEIYCAIGLNARYNDFRVH
jgi:predicted GIY-YIG superfamily endonuclease